MQDENTTDERLVRLHMQLNRAVAEHKLPIKRSAIHALSIVSLDRGLWVENDRGEFAPRSGENVADFLSSLIGSPDQWDWIVDNQPEPAPKAAVADIARSKPGLQRASARLDAANSALAAQVKKAAADE